MRRMIIGMLVLATFLSYAADRPSSRRIDLNKPGAMEQLAQENPTHHAKVQRILAEVQRHPIDSVPKWMKTEFDADQVVYDAVLLKTSDPAKRHLRFKLDDTSYAATLMQPQTERLVPVK